MELRRIVVHGLIFILILLEKVLSNMPLILYYLMVIGSHNKNQTLNPIDLACINIRKLGKESTTWINGDHSKCCSEHECLTMFKCYKSYCIPYHHVCDGTEDRPSGEDESNCEELTCPGLLKCKTEGICLLDSEVCDGVSHCMQSKDDGMHCSLQECPIGCHCHGLTLQCINMFLKYIPKYDSRTRCLWQ